MYMDKQSAREMVESVLWWETQIARAWNATFGRILGKQPLQEVEAPTVVLVEETSEE